MPAHRQTHRFPPRTRWLDLEQQAPLVHREVCDLARQHLEGRPPFHRRRRIVARWRLHQGLSAQVPSTSRRVDVQIDADPAAPGHEVVLGVEGPGRT
jgi:hypothetical protein